MKFWKLVIVAVTLSMGSALSIDHVIENIPAWVWIPYGLFVGLLCAHINFRVMEYR